MHQGEEQAQQRRLRRLVLGWSLLALLISGAVVAVAPFAEAAPPEPWLLATLWGLTVLAGVAVVHLHYGMFRESVSPIEIAAVLVMALLPPRWAILVAITALPVGEAIVTRMAPRKMAFNAASQLTGTAVGSLAFHAISGPGFAATPRDVVAATVAALLFVAVNGVAFAGLTGALSGQAWRTQVRDEVSTRTPLNVGMGMTGVVAAVLAVRAPAALPLLAVPTAMDYVRARARRQELAMEVARSQAEAANKAKSEFLSHMSHEVRTPLTAIMGFGHLLGHADLDLRGQEALGHILNAGRHLQSLMDDVLDLSSIEAGAMTLAPETVHLRELIQDATALVRPMADERSIRLLDDEAGRDVHIRTDRRRCQQILLNLLSNAVKYNREGGAVTISCEPREDDTVRLAVRDDGPGIDPARQHHLFQPFNRLAGDVAGVQGTGLGLALTKELVEVMGGRIGFDTAPGQGSTFWFDLPVNSPVIPERATDSS